MNYAKICAMLAAHNLYKSGVTIDEIARQANKTPATIRKWLRNFQ
jgi:predicted transcriptional regulator